MLFYSFIQIKNYLVRLALFLQRYHLKIFLITVLVCFFAGNISFAARGTALIRVKNPGIIKAQESFEKAALIFNQPHQSNNKIKLAEYRCAKNSVCSVKDSLKIEKPGNFPYEFEIKRTENEEQDTISVYLSVGKIKDFSYKGESFDNDLPVILTILP